MILAPDAQPVALTAQLSSVNDGMPMPPPVLGPSGVQALGTTATDREALQAACTTHPSPHPWALRPLQRLRLPQRPPQPRRLPRRPTARRTWTPWWTL